MPKFRNRLSAHRRRPSFFCRRRILGLSLAALVLLGPAACIVYREIQSMAPKRLDPSELSALLQPAYRVFRPDGSGPFPTAILASGCDGPKDNMARWAKMLNAEGWAAVVVDSHSPRDFDDAQRWRLICVGQLLPGGERAGDIAIAIDDVRQMPFADPDRLLLMGASHGGWAILDLLALHGQDRRPHNLTHWPGTAPASALDGVVGAIVLYPYCGGASEVRDSGWTADTPVLFILVEHDTIVDEAACLRLAERMRKRGKNVELHVMQNTTHGFDQADKNAFSTLEFSPESLAEAKGVVTKFLNRKVSP